MTDVSTYIEAEDYVEKFYENYYSTNNSSKVNNHTPVYIDVPGIPMYASVKKDTTKKATEMCKTS